MIETDLNLIPRISSNKCKKFMKLRKITIIKENQQKYIFYLLKFLSYLILADAAQAFADLGRAETLQIFRLVHQYHLFSYFVVSENKKD